jgi:hypothetical protein
MDGREPGQTSLERLSQLAHEVADGDPGPAGDLACALADEVIGLAGRVDALCRLIITVVETAGIQVPGSEAGGADAPPPEFVQALAARRGTGHRGVRLSIDGTEWVAAISQDKPPADPGRAWAALRRLTTEADHQDPAK